MYKPKLSCCINSHGHITLILECTFRFQMHVLCCYRFHFCSVWLAAGLSVSSTTILLQMDGWSLETLHLFDSFFIPRLVRCWWFRLRLWIDALVTLFSGHWDARGGSGAGYVKIGMFRLIWAAFFTINKMYICICVPDEVCVWDGMRSDLNEILCSLAHLLFCSW